MYWPSGTWRGGNTGAGVASASGTEMGTEAADQSGEETESGFLAQSQGQGWPWWVWEGEKMEGRILGDRVIVILLNSRTVKFVNIP